MARRGRKPGVHHRRAQCGVCGVLAAVKLDGLLFRHGGQVGPEGITWCKGSNRPPRHDILHVHKCACGATWDEHAGDQLEAVP